MGNAEHGERWILDLRADSQAMNRPPVTLYSFSFAHHGKFSSFHRLLHYSTGCHVVDITVPFHKFMGPRWAERVNIRWRRLSEWRLRPVFARKERQCVHYLYPENSLFRGVEWKGGHGLVLSCHQPGEFLRSMRHHQGYAGFFRALQRADRVVLLASRFADDYARYCGSQKVVVIPHGVDAAFFRPGPVEEREPLVLTVGNWLRDYAFWLRAAKCLAGQVREVTFAVVASPQTVENVRVEAREALGERVRFLQGLTDLELRALYQKASVLFLPLIDAGANNALLEAMATGLPIVTTDLSATREYAGNCGVYYQADDLEQCLGKMCRLMEDKDERLRLGEDGRKRAESQFSWPVIAAKYAQLYREVLAGCR